MPMMNYFKSKASVKIVALAYPVLVISELYLPEGFLGKFVYERVGYSITHCFRYIMNSNSVTI